MAKYSNDLNDSLVNKVKSIAVAQGLTDSGIEVWPLALNKIGKDVGVIVKGSDLTNLKAGKNVVAVALLEEAFNRVDDKTQNMWIEGLLAQVYYDAEKEKIKIEKPEITISTGMYNKYQGLAVDMAVLGQLTIEQLREEEQERKEQEKMIKKEKKQRKK